MRNKPVPVPVTETHIGSEGYTPGVLLDYLKARFHIKNDATLAHRLLVPHPTVSKLRHRKLELSPALLLRMHEITGVAVEELRKQAGAPRPLPLVALVLGCNHG